MRYGPLLPVFLLYAVASQGVASPAPTASPLGVPRVRAQIARGATCVGTAIRRKYPRETIARLIRNCVEKNVQKGNDSDGFGLGVHLVAAYWTAHLPDDVTWRTTALAQHCDVVRWLLPRAQIPLEEAVHESVVAAGLPHAAEPELVSMLSGGRGG